MLAEEEGELRLEPPATLATGALSGLPADGLLARLMSENKGVIDGKILPALVQEELTPTEAAWLDGGQALYWLPLVVDGRLWGVLLLGPQSNGRLLSGEDRRVLRHVAHQAALAPANIYLADILRASRAELARAHSELLLVREEERQQLAWALHDGPIQNLLAIGHRLAMLTRQLPHKAEEVAQLRQDIIGEVNLLREMYSQLRPGVLDELGLFQALRALVTPPTPPPRPAATWVPLEEPISTEVEALEMALYYDSIWSRHEEPWDIDTWRTEPGRIDVREYASLAEVEQERRDAGKPAGGSFGPDAGAPDAGGVWRITIKGQVQIGLARPGNTFESVTYIIAKGTGNLLSIGGEFVE